MMLYSQCMRCWFPYSLQDRMGSEKVLWGWVSGEGGEGRRLAGLPVQPA